jgi:repressor LexA
MENLPTVAKNLQALRSRHRLSQQELADIAGVSNVAVSRWETGKSDPRVYNLQRIADHFGMTLDELRGGAGGMAAKGIKYIAPIPSHTYARVLGAIAAGEPLAMAEEVGSHWVDPDVQARYPNAFFLTVQGDSMDRLLPDGAFVLIDPDGEVRDKDVCAVNVNGYDATVKRIHFAGDVLVLHPESDNPGHKALSIDRSDPDAEHVRVIGKAVWYVMDAGHRL